MIDTLIQMTNHTTLKKITTFLKKNYDVRI